ncbi:DeoR/GlpR family DNA-binding transcription regulator [Bacillus alkalicellulosilyticus]|uniref:DeoR/GlpR family DNA-binding transcription regulator n=1 Tax=Alkalihalobacterium alkalicellulosilyticum TaxID=1912214 RepID=UPI000997A917|nr:DeoR/GlpR family DNA-binding transcription regulator [Bacillus alkalicellulosilyticus]
MLTFERQQFILSLLKDKQIVKIQELVDRTEASESTIRRDLTELEQQNKLKRIHGGASLLSKRLSEPTIAEREVQNKDEKKAIAKKAASIVEEGDCIFLDAGTTISEMIPYLKDKNCVVVTNGVNNIPLLLDHGIETHVIGGTVKSGTRAFVGRGAIQGLENFRFDKSFIGTNGIHLSLGLTTPDPQEALIKETAISYSQKAYIVTDHTKFGETYFSKFACIEEVTFILSDKVEDNVIEQLRKKTEAEVVKL